MSTVAQWQNIAAPNMSNEGILKAGALARSSIGSIADSIKQEGERRKEIINRDLEAKILSANSEEELAVLHQSVVSPDNPYRNYVDPLKFTKNLQDKSKDIKDKVIRDLEYTAKKSAAKHKNRIQPYQQGAELTKAVDDVVATGLRGDIELANLTNKKLTQPKRIEAENLELDKLSENLKLDKKLRSRIHNIKDLQTQVAERVAQDGFDNYDINKRRTEVDLYTKHVLDSFTEADKKAMRVKEGADKETVLNTISDFKSMLLDTSNTKFLELVKRNGGIPSLASALALSIRPEDAYFKFEEWNPSPQVKAILKAIKTYQNEKRLVGLTR